MSWQSWYDNQTPYDNDPEEDDETMDLEDRFEMACDRANEYLDSKEDDDEQK